jgi:ATP-dependent exoDNAse (exonuclease V) beta subunit
MSPYQHLLDEDDASRIEALEFASFIVEAPAGAGKTELLTQRYLKLLATVDSPEEIIAITFTNKAASEMKKRIMDSLVDANSGQRPSLPHKIVTFELGQKALARSAEKSWELLTTPSRLRIYTIDSLSGNLARQMPLLSRFGTQPAVREDASLYYQEAATRTLANLDDAAEGPVVQQALRYFDNDHFRLNALLAEMLAKRDQWQYYVLNHHDASLAEAALAHLVTQDMQALAEVMPLRVQEALMPIGRYAASNLPCDASVALLRDWETPIPFKPEALAMWRAVVDLVLTGTNTFRKTVNVKNGFPATPEGKLYKDQLDEVINTLQHTEGAELALKTLKELPNPKYDEQSWQIILALAHLLKLATAELWLVFQQHGEVDFVQISQNALFALGDAEENPTDLALKLDYRIKHLLVDEFQDTSPTQIKLIEHLTQGWIDGDGRTLFLVGDPMQSIYRFRKANVGLFLRVAQKGIGALSLNRLKLWRNNRSHAPVIEWVNDTFKKVFPDEDSVSRGAISYRAFVAKEHDPDGAGVCFYPMLDGDSSIELDDDIQDEAIDSDVREREANQIIEIIKATWAENPDRKIAVLVRARSHLHALVAEIRRNHAELSFQAVEIEELANRQVVQDLLSLTNALHQRADRVHWLAILRAPWCGLTLKDLHQLVGGDQYSTLLHLMNDEARLQRLSDDGRMRLLHLRSVMQEALDHRGRMSTSRWVHGAWVMLGGPACLWDSGDVRDVQAFFDRIDRMEASGQFSTQQLAIEVQKLYAAPDAKAKDLLQFMTIHKSKGLEFDTVILPGLDKTIGRSDQPLMMWEEVPREGFGDDVADVDLVVAPMPPKGKSKANQQSIYDYMKSLEKQRAAYEDARVLYVAVTRAERCLHLLGAVKPNKNGELQPKKNTFLDMLWPVVVKEFSEDRLSLNQADIFELCERRSSAKLEAFVPQLVRLNKPHIPEVLHAAEVAYSIQRGSASANDEKDITIAASVGTLVHRYLELMAQQSLDAWSFNRLEKLKLAMVRWLTQQGHSLLVATEGASLTISLLKTTLESEQGRWILQSHEHAQNELEIESKSEGLVIQKRVIDRTFVENGVRWIVDYKTTSVDVSLDEAGLKQAAEQYREQLEQYRTLFVDEGLEIKLAIYFVSIGKLANVSN